MHLLMRWMHEAVYVSEDDSGQLHESKRIRCSFYPFCLFVFMDIKCLENGSFFFNHCYLSYGYK